MAMGNERSGRDLMNLLKAVAVLSVFLVPYPAAAISYDYDSLNRLIKVTYDDGGTVEYEYDATGNITRVVETPARIKQGKPKEKESIVEEGSTDSNANPIESSPRVKSTRGN